MNPEAPLTPPQEDEALAAELALGLLDADETRAARARMAADPDFAAAVCAWQERLAALAENLTPVMAPARARQGIRERLGHAAPPLSADPAAPRPWWRGPVGALAGLAAVAAAAALLWLPSGQGPVPGPDQPSAIVQAGYQARLTAENPALEVAARVEGRQMLFAMQSGPAPEGRDWEIWWVEPDGSAPVSLGVLPRSGDMRMTLPEGMQPSDQIRIALSDEPAGGSPTGQATGPVVAIAALTAM